MELLTDRMLFLPHRSPKMPKIYKPKEKGKIPENRKEKKMACKWTVLIYFGTKNTTDKTNCLLGWLAVVDPFFFVRFLRQINTHSYFQFIYIFFPVYFENRLISFRPKNRQTGKMFCCVPGCCLRVSAIYFFSVLVLVLVISFHPTDPTYMQAHMERSEYRK